MSVIDMAYQGFGEGLDADAYGLRLMADAVDELILCSSCSKNFGLYRERIGACSIIGKSAESADVISSVLMPVVRVNYSMPPAHGAAIVETILSSDELSIYLVGSSRISVAAISPHNVDYLARSIAKVL